MAKISKNEMCLNKFKFFATILKAKKMQHCLRKKKVLEWRANNSLLFNLQTSTVAKTENSLNTLFMIL